MARMARLFSRAKRSSNAVTPVMNHMTYEYPLSAASRNEWSTPAGVIIDGACYSLEGEPLPYPPSVHFGGNGQL